MGSGKKPIADLPANVSVYPIETSKGYRYWRVLVGKRFTGGEIVSKNFRSIQEARKWILGDGQKLKANPGSLLIAILRNTAKQIFSEIDRRVFSTADRELIGLQ